MDLLSYTLLDKSNYFTFDRNFISSGLCNLEEACVIQDLINRGANNERKGRVKKGWFLCTVDFLEKSLGLTKKVQSRIFSSLIKKKLLENRRKGIPPRRYIRINIELILGQMCPSGHLCKSPEGNLYREPEGNLYIERKNRKERKKSAVASDMPTDPFLASPLLQEDKTEPKEFDKDIARELWTIVLSTGCRNPKSKVEEWASHIRLLRKKDNVPKKLIREVIEWYSIHTGQNFVPEIMSGKALRDKWDKLIMAIKRDQQQEVTKKETPEEKEMREIDEYYERQLNKEEELYGTRTGKRIV